MEEFAKRKAAALAAMASPAPDKSPKGAVDAGVVPLLDILNRHPAYFTTSSCSGRISILAHPGDAAAERGVDEDSTAKGSKKKKKAGGGGWVFVSHDPAEPEAVVDILFGRGGEEGPREGDLVFRFEPLIVAVECRDVAAAHALVSAAISCGFRESGISNAGKRVMVAVRCSIRLEVPLGQIGRIQVSSDYVRYLVTIANGKMEANRLRTDSFVHVLLSKPLPEPLKETIDFKQEDQDHAVKRDRPLVLKVKRNVVLPDLTLEENDAIMCHDHGSISGFLKDELGSKLAENIDGDKSGHDLCKKLLQGITPFNQEESGEPKVMSGTEPNTELSTTVRCCLSPTMIKTVGEPTEKLFLWGQTANIFISKGMKQILVFGGFGGLGRHARRADTLVLDPHSGSLRQVDTINLPSPRLGHTCTVIGNKFFVIGGRNGPSEILNDVWVLQTSENKWCLLECGGSNFSPRHRHTSAAIGSNIFVFGGLNNEVIYSSMNVLNTVTFEWSEVRNQGEWPCTRHSHSMVAIGPHLFMFGGYDGCRALGDLYSFDTRSLEWKREKTTGRDPFPRFSHSMFVYRNFLGVIGGCPVRQQNQELSLLNLNSRCWLHVTVESSLGRELWVRSSTCVVDDELVIIGGGASCYAFGTKFNQPMKFNLCFLNSACDQSSYTKTQSTVLCHGVNIDAISQCNLKGHDDGQEPSCDQFVNGNQHSDCDNGKHFILQFEKRYAKLAKDILKKFGWLDLSRKVCRSTDDFHILFPITSDFHALFEECLDDTLRRKKHSTSDISQVTEVNRLLSLGGSLLNDDSVCSKKNYKTPQTIMRELVCSLLNEKEMPLQLLKQLPTRWELLGDIVVLPKSSFVDPLWHSIEGELWPAIVKALGAQRLARQGRVLPTGTRDSTLEILFGDNGWVTHQENGIVYSFDATKCMFSFGNLSEKLRMAHLDCRDEVIVDLFAGIGYFVLPFLVKARAKLVYACEWNPHAVEALRYNVEANLVANRCIILEGDNRIVAPKGVADRVCLGLLPSSECSWDVAVRALRLEGGVLHVHGNVNDSEETSWMEFVVKSISKIAQAEGLNWDISLQHVERVKWYGPHIRHLVADIRCKQL